MLYGAIIGDIAGSIYEFDNIKKKPEDILLPQCFFTDDTVMTIAVADAINNGDLDNVGEYMRDWGNRYPGRGYGGRFAMWLRDPNMGPYRSCGNGSAMRVSPAGWAGKSESETIIMASKIAAPTHNHPKGIKGAKAIATAIYMLRMGCSKNEVKKSMVDNYGYRVRSCDSIRPTYKFNETCQGTVPEAISAFLESTSFEDCIKLSISLGGDSDTLACIAGSMAEAYYGIPVELKQKCREYLTDDILAVIDEFENGGVCNGRR